MSQKSKTENMINTIGEIITTGRNRGMLHQYTENQFIDGKSILIDNKPLINFGSCSYLGLETDERLKEASIQAIKKFGTQFSSSRTYLSLSLYEELEHYLSKIFGKPVLLAPSTTLGHQAVIPTIISDSDAIILDQQAHYSMQDTVEKLQLRGITVTKLRHNRLDELQEKYNHLCKNHQKVWYFIDGVYSMYGDIAPYQEINKLIGNNKQLYLYVDDAHGMSWAGKNGAGTFLSYLNFNPKVVLTTSLAKGFGSAGGVIILPNENWYWKVKNWGGPLTHSGPQQPAVLGASVESAKIHLSSEIDNLQDDLMERILFCNEMCMNYGIPLISESISPIFFIGLGLTKVGYNMVNKLKEAGYYTNLGIYPAVPESCTGIRFTINRHHTYEDIENLVKSIAYHLPKALKEEERTIYDINRAFRKYLSFTPNTDLSSYNSKSLDSYKVQCENTIKNIPKSIWNNLLSFEGGFDWEALNILERVYQNNSNSNDNWNFYYFIIRDEYNEPLIATFLTYAKTKDDMLLEEHVSRKLEKDRNYDPNLYTSNSLILGSLLTEGNHIFINKYNKNWKIGLAQLMDHIWELYDSLKADNIILRDFDKNDEEIGKVLADLGFIKTEIPETLVIKNKDFSTREDYINSLHSKKRNLLKRNALRYEEFISTNIINDPNEVTLKKWQSLYKNVRDKKYEINTFPVPFKMFKEMAKSPNWDCLQITVNNTDDQDHGKIIGIMFNYKGKNYSSVLVGLDYEYLESHRVYKQLLFQTVLRGIELGVKFIYLGFTASLEKRKLGATAYPKVAYVQMQDDYKMQLLNLIPKTQEEA